MGLERYLDLLRAPGAAPVLAAATVGSGLAVGATAPFVGRLVDRLGQTRVLVTTACSASRPGSV